MMTFFARFKRLINLNSNQLAVLPLLVLYITDGCNSRCATCDIWRNPRRNMALGLASALADAAAEIGLRWVLLSGGEAMQHPEWPQIAALFKAQGVRVMLLTNGLLVRKQIDLLLASVDDLIISLDAATPELYAAIRGVDALELVLEGIRVASAAGLPVTTRTTVQAANYAQLPAIVDVALGAGAQHASFLAIDLSNPYAFGARSDIIPLQAGLPAGALNGDQLGELEDVLAAMEVRYAAEFADGRIAESPAKLRRILLRYFHALHAGTRFDAPPCNAPHFSTVVEVDGTLRPCYFLPAYGRMQPGQALSAAINVPAAQALREAYRTGQRAECATCVCPLHKNARALWSM